QGGRPGGLRWGGHTRGAADLDGTAQPGSRTGQPDRSGTGGGRTGPGPTERPRPPLAGLVPSQPATTPTRLTGGQREPSAPSLYLALQAAVGTSYGRRSRSPFRSGRRGLNHRQDVPFGILEPS